MPPVKDMTGQVFGSLTVLSRAEKSTSSGQACWTCLCSCGKTFVAVGSFLRNGNTQSCGHARYGPKSRRWSGHGEISGTYWGSLVSRARRWGHEFEVSLEYIWDLFLEQERRCALSGLALAFATQRTTGSTASLDRIDSSLGYVPGNVQWVHKDVNTIKRDYDQGYFVYLCEKIAETHRTRNV